MIRLRKSAWNLFVTYAMQGHSISMLISFSTAQVALREKSMKQYFVLNIFSLGCEKTDMKCEWKIFSSSQGRQNWLREANFEISSARRAREISKASRSQFCLPRELEKVFTNTSYQFEHIPKEKILRTDCFISFLRVFVCI